MTNTKGLVLIIEDDKSILNFLGISMKTNGYSYDIAENGLNGISLFMTNKPDLILLDLGLPDIDGTEVIKQVRMTSKTPIIVISSRGQEKEKVEALDLGANDYLTKPFSVNELFARIRVAMRSTYPIETADEIFTLDALKIDFEKRQVFIDEEEIHLTPIEYKILVLLVKNAGKVLTHTYIQNEIWGYSEFGEHQSLRVFMANIRRKIEKDTNHPRYIMTEVGVGYRFVDR
ncbi:response regulator [Diplocloster modestus]|uniref:Stage 0 sporulation protein A homolog n=1 Tax=Diplocloster modestus TaxID=2850322 RepID=A0ABS6KBZ3_9FIRM|nr:response regulator transcription factor [Diplocloster modestus]MBU9728018.1 response regulator transcription factor [Diplocloster modestus]